MSTSDGQSVGQVQAKLATDLVARAGVGKSFQSETWKDVIRAVERYDRAVAASGEDSPAARTALEDIVGASTAWLDKRAGDGPERREQEARRTRVVERLRRRVERELGRLGGESSGGHDELAGLGDELTTAGDDDGAVASNSSVEDREAPIAEAPTAEPTAEPAMEPAAETTAETTADTTAPAQANGEAPERPSVLAAAMQDVLLPAQHASRGDIDGLAGRLDAFVAMASENGATDEVSQLELMQRWLQALLQLPVYDDSKTLLGAASNQVKNASLAVDKGAKVEQAKARLERAKDARFESDANTRAEFDAEDAKVKRNEKRVEAREKKAARAGKQAVAAQTAFKTRYEAYNDWLAEQPATATLDSLEAEMDDDAWEGRSGRANRLERVLERLRLSYTIKGHGAWRAEEKSVAVAGIGAGHAVDVKANDLGLLGATRDDRSTRARELRLDQEEDPDQDEQSQAEEERPPVDEHAPAEPTAEAAPYQPLPLDDMSEADLEQLHGYLNSPEQFEDFRQQLVRKLVADNTGWSPERLEEFHDTGENFTATGACYQTGPLMTRRLKQMGRKAQTKHSVSKERIPGLGEAKDHVWTWLPDDQTIVDGSWKQFWKPIQREGHDPEPTADDWMVLNELPNVFTGTQEALRQLVHTFNHRLSKPFSEQYIEGVIALYDPEAPAAKFFH